MSTPQWQRKISETISEIQQGIPLGGPVFTADAIRMLVEQIGKAIEKRRLTIFQVRFVTAVEGLAAVEIAKERKRRMIDDSIMEEAFRKNHLPGEEPWQCMTSIMRSKPQLLREREGLNRFA